VVNKIAEFYSIIWALRENCIFPNNCIWQESFKLFDEYQIVQKNGRHLSVIKSELRQIPRQSHKRQQTSCVNLHKLNSENWSLREVRDTLDVDQLLLLFTTIDHRVDRLHLDVQLWADAVKDHSTQFHLHAIANDVINRSNSDKQWRNFGRQMNAVPTLC